MKKIKSPKTNRYINVGGKAYNNLIKNGYTNDYLLSLVINDKQNYTLSNIDDIDLQIIKQSEDVYSLCQTNKRLYKLCMSDKNIKGKYFNQQKIYNRINYFINFLETSDKIDISVNWKPRIGNLSGDFIKDGYFILHYHKNKFYISSYLSKYKKSNNITLISKIELQQLLFYVLYNNANVDIGSTSYSTYPVNDKLIF